jgi:protein TonB
MTDIGRRGKGGSKRGSKGGPSRPRLQESLEELTRLADDLVDSLSDDAAVDEAPAESAAEEEIFLDLDENAEEAVDIAIEEPAAGPEIKEVASTVAPSESPEEFEVVDPSEQPPAAATRESEVPAESDGAALRETLEELDLIGRQEPSVVQRFEVEFAGDKGDDIDAHLDTLFGSEPAERPSEAPPEPPTAVAAEPTEPSFEELNDTQADVEDAPLEQAAVAPESRDVPEPSDATEPAQSIFDEIEDTPRPAADTTDFHVALHGAEPAVDTPATAPAVETVGASHEASRSKKWLALVAAFVVVATVAAWVFFSRTSGDAAPATPSSAQQASLVLPEPVASPHPTEPPLALEVQQPATIAAEAEVPVETPVEEPTPPPVKKAAPVEKPTPPPVKKAAPVEKPTPPPVEVAALVEVPTPAPVAIKPAPAAPALRVEPPEVVSRIEPVLNKKSRKQQGTVVLNVLVNESGRVVRVVVDEGIPGSPLEAAAIDAVLRWEYRPGTENGSPVRAWVTETFVFEP